VIRALPYLVALALVVYCLVDAIQTPSDTVRVLPRVVWMIVIVVIPFLGPLAWLVAGRPKSIIPSTSRNPPTTTRGPLGPDDDPDYLRRLSEDARREQRARDRAADGEGKPPAEEPGPRG
jgi:hypothetical protein